MRCNRDSSVVSGLDTVSLEGVEGVEGLLVVSSTVSSDDPCPPVVLEAGRGPFRSTFVGSSAGSDDLLCDVFGRVDSSSLRRFAAHDGILFFSGLATLADSIEAERINGFTGEEEEREKLADGECVD